MRALLTRAESSQLILNGIPPSTVGSPAPPRHRPLAHYVCVTKWLIVHPQQGQGGELWPVSLTDTNQPWGRPPSGVRWVTSYQDAVTLADELGCDGVKILASAVAEMAAARITPLPN